MRRWVVVLVAVLATSACGGATLTAPAPPEGVAVGGEATVGMPRPATLDPSNVLDASGEVVVRTMCDPLIDVDRETGALVPALAEAWIVTDGGSRIVLRLRDGLTFPDGTPVSARDAVWSLSRAASQEFAGENADLLQGIRGWSILRGRQETDDARLRRELAGLRVVSETAFEISLDVGAQFVLPILSHPTASILSRAAAEADPEAFDAAPVCVGPYRPVTPFDPRGDTFTVERVAGYAGVDTAFAGGGQGFLERIEFHWSASDPPDGGEGPGVPVVAPPAAGELDVVALAPADLRRATSTPDVEVVSVPSPWMHHLGIPDALLPADGRRALSMALDRRALAAVGGWLPASGFLPPSLGPAWHRTDACGGAVPERPDVAGARALLDRAGLDLRGVAFPVVTNGDFDNVALVTEVVRQWREAFPGFGATFRQRPWEEMEDAFEDLDGFATAFRTSHHVPYPSAPAWLSPFLSASIGTTNGVAFSDGLLDELVLHDAARAIDPADRAVVLHEAEDRLCQQLPMLPLVVGQRHWAVRSGLGWSGGLADPVTGGLLLRNLHRPGG